MSEPENVENKRCPVARRRVFPFLVICIVALTGTVASMAKDIALGSYLSAECVTCHQITGRYDGIPPITGWPETSFIEIMGEYRQKKRPNPLMQTIAQRLSDEEIAALAAYFGNLPQQAATK